MLETVINYSQLWKLWNLHHASVGTTYIVEKEQTNKRSNSDSYYTSTRGYRKCSTVIISMHANFHCKFFFVFNFRCLPAPQKLDDNEKFWNYGRFVDMQ